MKKNCVSNSQKEEERRKKKERKGKERKGKERKGMKRKNKTYPLDHHVTFRPLDEAHDDVRPSTRNDFLSVLQFVNVHN